MASYLEVVLVSVPSLEGRCYVSPSLAQAIPSQVVGTFSRVAGPLVLSVRLTAHLPEATFLWSTRMLCVSSRMLRNFRASPLCLRDTTRIRACAVRAASPSCSVPLGFDLIWSTVVTSRQQRVLSTPRSGRGHVTVLAAEPQRTRHRDVRCA